MTECRYGDIMLPRYLTNMYAQSYAEVNQMNTIYYLLSTYVDLKVSLIFVIRENQLNTSSDTMQ